MKKLITIIAAIAAISGSTFAGYSRAEVKAAIEELEAFIATCSEPEARNRAQDLIDELKEAAKEYYGEPKRERSLTGLERIIEQDAQSNPLMYGRPSTYEQYSKPVKVPVIEGISPEVARVIPFAVPPRPIEYMPIEQQKVWNRLWAETAEKQVPMQNKLNRLKSTR